MANVTEEMPVEDVTAAITALQEPASGMLQMLCAMGFQTVLALNAIRQTHACNIDAAMTWIEENQDSGVAVASLLPLPLPQVNVAEVAGSAERSLASMGIGEQKLKMMLVVRADLGMGVGKVAAQCAHAAVGLYQQLAASRSSRLSPWAEGGQKKIVVRARDLGEMKRLAAAAVAAGVPHYIVVDAGRTEVVAGSPTVIAIGPALDAEVNPITGELELLR
ncbi:peptidyl-tRNA hydrolase PTH2-domain-containing protein [Pavlovales sp. CCMP2436]|nr:peptidyl-tRNA hydrolase PTH2-domain-containing protein [Pavlovales sp. CCMP2436]